jgi:transglutaminase-like putative cysteine protease
MRVHVSHRTTYRYSQPVAVSHHVARFQPKALPSQQIESAVLRITPEPAVRKSRRDYFGNDVCFFSVQNLHTQLEVVAESVVKVTTQPTGLLSASPAWEAVVAQFGDVVSPEVMDSYQYIFESPLLRMSPELAEYALPSFPPGTPLLAGALDLCRRIHDEFGFSPMATTVATPLEVVMQSRQGVCQDFAHVAIASLRSIGLPARYVSGYLRTLPPAGQPRLVGADASHAWFSVFCPARGWVDFDPTNNLLPAGDHITVAYGRDFSDVSPLAGILTGGGAHQVIVGVDVEAG